MGLIPNLLEEESPARSLRKGEGVEEEEVVMVVVGKLSGEKQLREARELKMAVTLVDYQLIMGLEVLLQGVSLRTEEPVSNLRKQYKIHEPDHSKSATNFLIFNGMNLYQEVHLYMMRSSRFHSSRNQERKNHDLRQEEEPPELQVEYLMLHIQQHHDNKSSGKEKRKGKKKRTVLTTLYNFGFAAKQRWDFCIFFCYQSIGWYRQSHRIAWEWRVPWHSAL